MTGTLARPDHRPRLSEESGRQQTCYSRTPSPVEAELPEKVEQLQSAREALRARERRLAGIIESAMDAIITVDDEQNIVMFNPAAEKMFGLTAADALGRNLSQLIPSRFRSAHAQQVRDFGETNQTRRHIGGMDCLCGLRADGTEFPAEISISQIEERGVKLFTAIVRDISERKHAEDELSRRAEDLARSNRDLEQFAYVASHDLQEPLRMVAAYTQLLAERYRGYLDENADKYIAYVIEGTTRMQTLIQDLLAFSRIGRNRRERQNVDLEAVLDEAAENLKASIQESRAVLTRGKLPLVHGERSQLVQLFQNLIGNAIKFRGENAPRISISAESRGQECVFAVADNGIGIATEYRERVFEIFQRLHTRAEYPGNGIGLSICKKIVEQHGGRIWVESEPGQGATFKFILPAAQIASKSRKESAHVYATSA